MPCKGVHIPEQQRRREERRIWVSPNGSLSPAPVSRQTAALRSRGKNMHFHHWQWSSKSSVRWAQAENGMQHPCSSHRSICHFKIGETNMSGYSGRGLQSWGREKKQHAGQSRMCSWSCRCGRGKEENGGSFCRGYHISKLKVALV